MKRKLAIISSVLLFVSCKTLKMQENVNARNKEKKEWIFAFKAKVFSECLKHSGATIEKDASPSLNYQVLGDFKILSKTDSIGKSYSKVISERSVWLKGGDLDGYTATTNGCLSFFESRELDSVASALYEETFKKK